MYTPKKAYFYGTGRRKSSVARVRLFPGGTGEIKINNRTIDNYFGLETLKMVCRQPFEVTGTEGKFDVECTVTGGGFTGQAGAIRHGIARALLQADSDQYRAALKAAGFLTRDPRMKERKKYGAEGCTSCTAVLQALIIYSCFQSAENASFLHFFFIFGQNNIYAELQCKT